MNEINFNWAKKVSDEDLWQENFMLLTNFLEYNELKDLAIPIDGKPNPLYSWLNFQKTSFRNGRLLMERQEKLEELGIILDKVSTRGRKKID